MSQHSAINVSSGWGGGLIYDGLTKLFTPKATVDVNRGVAAAAADPADTARNQELATEGRLFQTSGVLAGGKPSELAGAPPTTSRALFGSTGLGGL